MRRDFKYRLIIYLFAIAMSNLLLLFSFRVQEKRIGLSLFENLLHLYFGAPQSLQHHFSADPDLVCNFLSNRSLANKEDSLIYKAFFTSEDSQLEKVQRFTTFIYKSSLRFSRTLMSVESRNDYYYYEIMITASDHYIVSLYIGKKDFNIDHVQGLKKLVFLYSRAIQSVENENDKKN